MKQVLDFIKTHTFALACGVVAILAMVAFFVYPVPGLFASLQAKLDERKPVYQTINTLRTETRTLPAIDPSLPEPPRLDVFPTTPVIAAGQEALAKTKEQAANVLAAAVKQSAKPLLRSDLPGASDPLPRPSTLAQQQFYDKYNEVTQQAGDQADKGIIRTVLHGTLPPTSDELARIEAIRTAEIQRNFEQRDAQGNVQNADEVATKIEQMRRDLPLEQKRYCAQNFSIYVSPGAVDVHPAMTSQQPVINAVTIFNAQYSLWLQTTVFEALVDANAGSTTVYDSPVKHLVRLAVPMNIAEVPSTPIGFGSTPAEPAPDLKPDASITLNPRYTDDPLGFTHNSMFDPVRVDLVIRVDFRRLPEVLTRLGRSQLVRIRNVSYRTVESAVALSQGFLYDRDGSTPIVEVTLDCDVLMLREWVVRYMPDPVKTYFNNLANPQQVDG